MPIVNTGNISIYYEIHGEGEPLVLIMGLGGDTTRWFRILPVLSKKYRVITFDNRGAGRSDKPDVPYTMQMLADDAAGLLDKLEIDAAHIFGISMGGMIAQHFALQYPQRVISLILGCTRCGGKHCVMEDAESSKAISSENLLTMSIEERERAILPVLWSEDFIENHPDVVEEHIRAKREFPIDPRGYQRQFEAANNHDTFDRLSEINVPTLIISGDSDRLIPVENSRILASRIPGAELVILKKMRHGFYTEARDETCRAIFDFIDRHH